jgi:hypothetical protein
VVAAAAAVGVAVVERKKVLRRREVEREVL